MSGRDPRAAGDEDSGFLSRWARRKQQVRAGVGVADAVRPDAAAPARVPATPLPTAASPASVPAETQPAALAPGVAVGDPLAANAPAAQPLPTMADVALLTRESDYARFVAPGIDEGVKQAAMKKLFADPHFNVMDGLDTYIDDYSQPDPIPLAMLRRMNQSKFLGLFDHEEAGDESAGDETAKVESTEPAVDAITAASSATVASTPAGVAPAPAEPEDSRDDHADLRLQQDDAAGRPGPPRSARA